MARVAAGPTLDFQISQKDIDKIKLRMEQLRGAPLEKRLQKGTLIAAQMLARYIRADTPVGPTGYLRRSVKAATSRHRYGAKYVSSLGAWAGPTAPHRNLVIRGHRDVTHRPARLDTGFRSRANPFVDAAAKPHVSDALRMVSEELFR